MHIYFSGIGGSGLFPLALLALDCGWKVSGSDSKSSGNTDYLADLGVNISLDQDGKSLKILTDNQPIDWFVQTSALLENHPELLMATELELRITKRDKLINYILAAKKLKLIAISGTHGKTTTTAMLAWLFYQFEIPVSYLIGSTISYGPAARYMTGSKYFVLECDEFDRNFLSYTPQLAIIPSLDYDHPDTYPTQLDYQQAFLEFINRVEGVTITTSKVITSLKQARGDIEDKVIKASNPAILTQITLTGEHNRNNALLTLGLFQKIESKPDLIQIIGAINRFPGSDRRFQKITDGVYSDYGHHPTEIAATLTMAREIIDSGRSF